MTRNASEFRVGLFVSVVLAVAAYIILSIQGNPFQKTFLLGARYSRVSGVKQGTAVTLAGHQVGEVEEVVPNAELRKVEVWMGINQEYESAILNDATASIVPLGFLGDVMIEITYGRLGLPVRDGEIIEGVEPMDWQSVIRGAAGDFRRVLNSVNDVVGNQTYQEDLGAILDNLSEFSKTLNAIVVPEDKADLDALFDLLRETASSIRDTADNLNELVVANKEGLTTSVGNVRTITDRVKEEIAPDFAEATRGFADLSQKLADLTVRIDQFVAANSENTGVMIANIKEAASTFQETLESAKTSLQRVEQGPGTLHDIVYEEDTGRELRGTLRSARGFFDQFSGLGGGLELKVSAESQWFFDDPENYYHEHDFRIGIIDPPPPFSIEGTHEVWSQSDNNRMEMDLAGQVFFGDYGVLIGADDVGTNPELDLLFLGKVPDTGGRLVGGFGVLEGEAGLRLEAFLVPDLLSLRLDAVGFTTADKERLDLSLRGQIWKNMHVIGGFESIVGVPRRRGFAGLRIEFGKKFGEKDRVGDEWTPRYDSEVYDGLFDSAPPTKPSKDPFAQDEALWEQQMVPAEEAPSRKP